MSKAAHISQQRTLQVNIHGRHARRHVKVSLEQPRHCDARWLCACLFLFLQYGCNGSVRKELPFTDPWLDFTTINPDGKSVSCTAFPAPRSSV
jgi:hypothetical protein